jgi:hypothetical protein
MFIFSVQSVPTGECDAPSDDAEEPNRTLWYSNGALM